MRDHLRLFVVSGLLIASALALLVSPWADSDPDGLAKVAQEEGFASTERDHALEDSVFSGYGIKGVRNDRISTGLAGLIGVLATFGLMICVLAIVRSIKAVRLEDRKGSH